MITKASTIFHFMRGALRGAYGTEDLRSRSFLLIGASQVGQEFLNHICIDGVSIAFQDESIESYSRSFAVCRDIDVYEGQEVDVVVDLVGGFLTVRDKAFPLSKIGDNPYTQGIHEFYL